MNPCPCGWLGARTIGRSCRCTPDQVTRYQGRLSGPLLDRIDLQVEVTAVDPAEMLAQPEGEASAEVAERVARADARQQARQGRPNAGLSGAQLDAASLGKMLFELTAAARVKGLDPEGALRLHATQVMRDVEARLATAAT